MDEKPKRTRNWAKPEGVRSPTAVYNVSHWFQALGTRRFTYHGIPLYKGDWAKRDKDGFRVGDLRARLYMCLRRQGWPKTLVTKFVFQDRSAMLRRRASMTLEEHPAVQRAVKQFQEEIGITQADVVAGMMDAVYSAASSGELLDAWREIGRILGFYAPKKVEVDMRHSIAPELLDQRIQTMSDAELYKLIEMQQSKSLGHEVAEEAEFVEVPLVKRTR